MFTVGRVLISLVALGMNFVIMPVCFYFGLLGINGSLSDTSAWENLAAGFQFLGIGGIALVNIFAIHLSRKRLTFVACGLNGLLVLFAAYHWKIQFDLFGRMIPPLDAIVPFCIAVGTVVALVCNRRASVEERVVQEK